MRISDWSSDVCSSDLVKTLHADGRPVTDKEVADFYVFARDEGERRGIEPSFEIHVNMWSEDFRRVATVARMVEARGLPWRMTLVPRHLIFKLDHPQEHELSGIAHDVAAELTRYHPYPHRP